MTNYLLNCFILLIPILAWNLVFTKYLPKAYSLESHGKTESLEKAFRFSAFVLPLIMPLSLVTNTQKTGLIIYIIGSLIYFASWLPQMYRPDSIWSKGVIGFLTPSYTPIIWFLGIALIGNDSFIGIPYFSIIYLGIALLFVSFHSVHTYHVFKQGRLK